MISLGKSPNHLRAGTAKESTSDDKHCKVVIKKNKIKMSVILKWLEMIIPLQIYIVD